jgi:hypothetical protein
MCYIEEKKIELEEGMGAALFFSFLSLFFPLFLISFRIYCSLDVTLAWTLF